MSSLPRWRRDQPGPDVLVRIDPDDPDAFTTDVIPALRQPDGTLLIPEALSSQ